MQVTKCHPRTIIKHRIVIVTIRRHGKKVRVRRRKTIHVIVLPHPVLKLKRRVAFGHSTTVSGWLGTYDGVALAGQAVEVLSAPDNGAGSVHAGGVGDDRRQTAAGARRFPQARRGSSRPTTEARRTWSRRYRVR